MHQEKGGPCSTYFNVEELADHRTKKRDILLAAEEHLKCAKKQRCHYQKQVQESPVPQDFQRQKNIEMEQHDMDVAPKSGKRLCSHCRLPGHTKTKRGKITCPKLL